MVAFTQERAGIALSRGSWGGRAPGTGGRGQCEGVRVPLEETDSGEQGALDGLRAGGCHLPRAVLDHFAVNQLSF